MNKIEHVIFLIRLHLNINLPFSFGKELNTKGL